MQDSQRYFEGRTGKVAAEQSPQPVRILVGAVCDVADLAILQRVDLGSALMATKNDIRDWSLSLSQVKLDRKAGDAALASMTHNVAARLDVNKHKSALSAPAL